MAYESQSYGCVFLLVLPIRDCCLLGSGGKKTGVDYKWLLCRDMLIIPIITDRELRKLRAEDKAAALLCQGIISC